MAVELGPTSSVPLSARGPDQAPDAVQLVALLTVQVSVELKPSTIVPGLALRMTIGGFGVTVTVAESVAPLQLMS